MSHRRRATVVLLAIAAVLVSIAVVLPASADAASRTRCHTTSKGGTTTRVCVTITRIYARQFKAVYRDGLINHTSHAATLSCTATVSKTTSFSVSTSVKAEAGFIFGSVSAEVSGGVSHSVTSGYSTSVSISVPAHKTLYCDRGIYTYRFAGQVSRSTCVNINCTSSVKNFSGLAPQRAAWRLSVGA